jgi:SOS-response transcriptional repressor LexA
MLFTVTADVKERLQLAVIIRAVATPPQPYEEFIEAFLSVDGKFLSKESHFFLSASNPSHSI